MKLVLSFLIYFSFFGSSYAWKVEHQPLLDSTVLLGAKLYLDSDWYSYSAPQFIYLGPSAEEIAMTAKIDSNELQLNLISDAIDSINQVQMEQSAAIKKLQ